MKVIQYINQQDVWRPTGWPKWYKQGTVSSNTLCSLPLIPTLSLSQDEEDTSQW